MEIDPTDITSTFVRLGPRQWEGTHRYEEVAVVRTLWTDDPGVLNVDTRYYTEEKLAERLTESYQVTREEDTKRPHSYGGKPISEFARSIHYTDVALDIDIALDHL